MRNLDWTSEDLVIVITSEKTTIHSLFKLGMLFLYAVGDWLAFNCRRPIRTQGEALANTTLGNQACISLKHSYLVQVLPRELTLDIADISHHSKTYTRQTVFLRLV